MPDPLEQALCYPGDAVFGVQVTSINGFVDPVTLSTSGEPAGPVTIIPNATAAPFTSTVTFTPSGGAAAGRYDIDIVGVAPTATHTTTVGLDLFTTVPGGITLQTPSDGAADVPVQPSFSWTAAMQEGSYRLEVAGNPGFSQLVLDVVVNGTS